jgi:hypothetical protein
MEEKEFKRLYQGDWVDHRPILIVAGRQTEFIHYMETLAKDAKAVVRKGGEWELDGQPYYFVNRMEQMRGIRAKDVQFIGTFYELRNVSDMEIYAKVCTQY